MFQGNTIATSSCIEVDIPKAGNDQFYSLLDPVSANNYACIYHL